MKDNEDMEIKSRGKVKELNRDEAWKEWQRYSNHYNSDYRKHAENTDKNYQFLYGNQYSSVETAQMTARGQYPLKINKLLTYMQTITGMFIGAKPMMKAMPQGIKDEVTSGIVNRMFSYIYDKSSGTLQLQDAVMNSFTNMAYLHVKQNESNQTVFEYLPYEDVVVDSGSKDPFFRDASVIYIHKYLRVEDAKKLYNLPDDAFNVNIYDYFQSYYSSNNERNVVGKVFSSNFQYVKIVEGYHLIIEKEFMQHPQTGEEVWTGATKRRIRKVTMLGAKYCFIEDLPESITEHCIVPLYGYNTKNVYKLSLVAMLRDYQRLLNKSYVTMLFNAQTLGSPRLIVEEGSIPNNDIDSFEDNYANPASVSVINRGTQPPMIIGSQQLPSSWLNIIMSMAQEIEFSTVPNNLMNGDTAQLDRKLDVYEKYQFILNKLRMFINVFEGAVAVLAKSASQYFITYSKHLLPSVLEIPEHMQIIQEWEQDGMTTDKAGFAAYLNKKISEGNVEAVIYKDLENYKKELEYIKKITYIENNPSFFDIDITVIQNSYLSTASQLRFATNMMMYDKGLVPASAVIKESDLENKDEILEEMDALKNLARQNAELRDVVEKYESEIEKMRQAVFEGEINAKTIQHEGKMDKERSQFRTKASADRKIHNAYTKVAEKEQQLQYREQQIKILNDLRTAIANVKITEKEMKKGVEHERNDINSNIIIDI